MINLLKVSFFKLRISFITKSLFLKKYQIHGFFSYNLLFSTESNIYKIPIDNKSTLLKEINNYKKVWSCFDLNHKEQIISCFKSNKNSNYLILQKYIPISPSEYFDAFKYVFLSMSFLDKQEKCSSKTLQNISFSMKLFEDNLQNSEFEILKNRLDSILQNPLSLGLCHGDLHSRNIMKDKNNQYKIIDLDCFKFCSVRDVDIVYYVSELLWLENKQNWKDNLLTLLNDENRFSNYFTLLQLNLKDAIFIFFLERFGQDYFYYNEYSEFEFRKAYEYLFIILNTNNNG